MPWPLPTGRFADVVIVATTSAALVATASDAGLDVVLSRYSMAWSYQEIPARTRMAAGSEMLHAIVFGRLLAHDNIAHLCTAFTPAVSSEALCMQPVYTTELPFRTFKAPCKPNMACLISYQLFCGLKYLHSAGVVHGNLTFDSLRLVDGRLVVADMQHARLADQPGCADAPRVLKYRPAEAILHPLQIHHPAVDVWAAACIMVEMHIARVLFDATNPIDALRRISKLLGPLPAALLDTVRSDQYRDAIVAATQYDGIDVALLGTLSGQPHAGDFARDLLQYAGRPSAALCCEHAYFAEYHDDRFEETADAALSLRLRELLAPRNLPDMVASVFAAL
jgi:serine/threonine protein kinase